MGEAEGFSREGNQHLPPRAAGIDGAESPSSGVKGYCTKGCPPQRAAGGLPFVCIHFAVAVKGYWQKASGSLLGGLVSVSKMLKSM